jgi:hypothetical protein
VVSGGRAVINNGIVEIAGSGGENVSFLPSGSGGLDLGGTGSTFSGRIFGFGGVSGSNSVQFIDLLAIGSSGATVSYTASASHPTSGSVLTVSSGGSAVAEINLVGNYTSATFHITSGAGGSVEITDPTVPNGGSVELGLAQAFPEHEIGLPNITFGAQTTLAYSENGIAVEDSFGVTEGRLAATIALLGDYMARTFTTTPAGQGGTLISGTPQAEQQSLLTHPPHG